MHTIVVSSDVIPPETRECTSVPTIICCLTAGLNTAKLKARVFWSAHGLRIKLIRIHYEKVEGLSLPFIPLCLLWGVKGGTWVWNMVGWKRQSLFFSFFPSLPLNTLSSRSCQLSSWHEDKVRWKETLLRTSWSFTHHQTSTSAS